MYDNTVENGLNMNAVAKVMEFNPTTGTMSAGITLYPVSYTHLVERKSINIIRQQFIHFRWLHGQTTIRVLFTVPSQYYALSVTKEYLALGGGPPDFLQGSTCLVVLRIPLAPF